MTSKGKRLLGLAFIVFCCAFTLHASTSDALTTLKQGSRGADVLNLQRQLQAIGYFSVTPTGYFGPVTQQSVLKLQRDYGLKVDGIVGSQTSYLIGKLTRSQNQNPTSLKSREVLGFYVGDEPGIPSSYATLEARKDTITSISPFWYRLDMNKPGNLEIHGSAPGQEIKNVMKFTGNNKIKNYALIHNLLYGRTSIGRDVVHTALSNPNTRWQLVMSIFNLLKTNGFNGVCLDIENIHPWDKGLYIQFMAELHAQLKPAGYGIVTCVPSKLSDKPNGGWGDNFDYQQVARYSDLVVVMAYDEHTAGSPPGPIASPAFVERVLKYTLTKIPPEKVLLGVPGYGFDWNAGQGTSRYLSYAMAMETARQNKKSIQWDSPNQSPYFYYTDMYGNWHTVYFENSSSLAAKLDIVNKYNLGGIAIWRLGMEDPDGWRVIKDKFQPAGKYFG